MPQKIDERSIYLRSLVFRSLIEGKRGHVGAALSIIEILRVLYDHIMHYDPSNPYMLNRDRFILSKGHGCLALYAILADKKFFDVALLNSFCNFDSILGGHPEITIPGVEASTGSLGHGLPIGVGMALSSRIKKLFFNVFVLVGDGEINEGTTWEAAAIASKHNLSNLLVLVDYNKMQSAGTTKEILDMEPLHDKWTSFGFHVEECNGHDINSLKSKLELLVQEKNILKPKCLICHTIKGKGLKVAENNLEWHHKSKLSPEEIKILQTF